MLDPEMRLTLRTAIGGRVMRLHLPTAPDWPPSAWVRVLKKASPCEWSIIKAARLAEPITGPVSWEVADTGERLTTEAVAEYFERYIGSLLKTYRDRQPKARNAA